MSAYLVEKDHIIFLLLAANAVAVQNHLNSFKWFHRGEWHELARFDSADIANRANWDKQTRHPIAKFAKTLADENIKSLRARYQEVVDHGFEFSADSFRAKMEMDPLQIIKSCNCFDYQCCEHKGWKKSSAKAFVDTLKELAIDNLPGYDAAIWGAPAIK